MKIKFYFIVFLILFLFGCNEDNETVSASGMISYINIEGGFYGIITDAGDNFLPENLTSDFRKDRLRVLFEGIITDRPTTVQWGRTITLTKIDSIP